MVRAGFVKQAHADKLIIETDPGKLIQRLQAYKHQTISKLTGEVID